MEARRTVAVSLEAASLLQSREVADLAARVGDPRKRATLEDFRDLFDELDVEESVREELRALTPAGYTGVGSDLVDELD